MQELLRRVRAEEEREIPPEEREAAIDPQHVPSAAATLYENVRYLLDYQEEHAIRRSAIERILKRLVLIERKSVRASALLAELIEVGYVSRGSVTRGMVRRVDASLDKYAALQPLLSESDTRRTVLGFVASEIETLLAPKQYFLDDAVVQAFYTSVCTRVEEPELAKVDLDMQTYCACRRALLNSDDTTLSYALWLLYVPAWRAGTPEEIEALAPKTPAIINAIHTQVQSPVQWNIAQKLKRECIYFRIIRELTQRDGSAALNMLTDGQKMEAAVTAFLEEKYAYENTKARSSGARAVSYLLLTKMVLALVIEAPYELYILGKLGLIPLLINILFHPLLLFALTLEVGAHGRANTEAVVAGMRQTIYGTGAEPIRVHRRIRFAKTFGFFYALFTLGLFGCILAILQFLSFNIVGMVLFYLFFVLVSYFAFRIRYHANRWKVLSDDALASLGNLVAIPIVRTGHWMSRKFSTVNIFVFIMDFIIETPFKRLLGFWHQFILYLKDNVAQVR